MSLFKSIKKMFKKFTKVVKKIAPYLLVAAAVYFGGSYMMSIAGGADAAAAGGVAKSFTKSAGVWKSFLGGLGSGSASASAAAYAEASYSASELGLTVSAQAAAGTTAVQALSGGLTVGESVTAGVNGAEYYTNLLSANPGISGADALNSTLSKVNTFIPETSPEAMFRDNISDQLVGSTAKDGLIQKTADTVTDQTQGQITTPTTSSAETVTKPQITAPVQSSSITAAGVDLSRGATVDMPRPGADATWQEWATYNSYRAEMNDQARHEQMMKIYDNQHRTNMIGLLMKGAGFGLTAWSEYQKGKDEDEERRRVREWKPTGKEVDIVDPSKLQYPGGIIDRTA